MIEVSGQYVISFSLGGFKDFLDEPNLELFSICEQAGNFLPYFSFQFTTYYSEVVDSIKEGIPLQVSLGRERTELTNIDLIILRKNITKVGKNKYKILLIGLYNNMGYLTDSQVFISKKIPGTQCIEEVAKKYWNVKNTATTSSDAQCWIQYNITDRNFINNIWIHTYIPGSVPLIGITSTGEFLIKDLKSLIGTEPVYNLTSMSPEKSKDITFDGDYVVDSNTGLLNQWYGYGRKKRVWNAEIGYEYVEDSESKTALAQSSKLDMKEDVIWRAGENAVINENVHENYHKAFLQNMQNLTVFSSNTIPINVSRMYFPIKVLDLVFFDDREIDQVGQNNSKPATKFVGLYIVTMVTRNISSKRLNTYIKLSRESFNLVK